MASRFLGHVDAVEPALAGWVIDRHRPNEPVRFSVIVDSVRLVTVVADRSRLDVAVAGHGGPNCGFEIPLPARLLDGQAHDIAMTLDDGQEIALPNWRSPIVLGPVTASIAPLSAADLDDVGDLLRQTYLEGGLDTEPITDKYIVDWIGSFVGHPGGELMGARVGGRVVGYAALERNPATEAAFGAVALSVVSHYRRKGIGERLMRALMETTHETGKIDQVWLSVEPRNLPARRLYEKLGFVHRTEPPSSLFVPATYLTMVWRPDRSAS
jgi:ribosomal protein S18 acetylase RimI-like enzyme